MDQLAAQLGNEKVLAADLSSDADLRRVERVATLTGVANKQCWLRGPREGSLKATSSDKLQCIRCMSSTSAYSRGAPRNGGKGEGIHHKCLLSGLLFPFSIQRELWRHESLDQQFYRLKYLHSPVRVQALCPGFTITEFHDVLSSIAASFLEVSACRPTMWRPLRGLQRNKLFVIPGWRYRLQPALTRWLPQALQHAIALEEG